MTKVKIVRIDDKNQDSVYRVLSMSYEDLPMQLKNCFLYLAHFPEDYKIEAEQLYYYWEAEGIITSSIDGETTRKIGEDYIEELVRRNMIIGVKDDLSCRWEYCQMHDMMREVCLYKAKEENFLQFIKVPTSSTSTISAHTPTRSRRLAVYGGDTLGCKNNKKVRSVLGFGLDSNLWKQSGQGLRNLQLLRVLHLSLDYKSDSRGGRIPSSIGKLIHLRYLSLDMGWGTHVPSSLQNLKLLIYFSIFSWEIVQLPSIFKEMVQLRFLQLPFVIDSKTKLELGNLVNLEYLGDFQSQYGSITDFIRMKKLRTLEINLKGRYTSEILASSLCKLTNLEELRLIDEINESDGAYDLDFVWNFIHLRHLELDIHMTRLPDHSRLPPHLAHISLRYCNVKEDPLQILEKLLHLKSVVLQYRSFVGRKMVCSKGGFPQLCKLEMSFLDDWEEWIVEEGSMPCLRTLSIEYCEKLKELPEGLKYITSLKELEIRHKNKEWKTKLVPGGESYHKVQHIPSVQLYYDSDE
uniref:Disease resistance protein n=1 Tax=Brassica campestris TaxID=3711 RepID=M4CM41_BRACM